MPKTEWILLKTGVFETNMGTRLTVEKWNDGVDIQLTDLESDANYRFHFNTLGNLSSSLVESIEMRQIEEMEKD